MVMYCTLVKPGLFAVFWYEFISFEISSAASVIHRPLVSFSRGNDLTEVVL